MTDYSNLKHGHGWVFVAHHPDDAKYASQVAEGLNKLGYQVWNKHRDAVYGDNNEDFERAWKNAAIVVSIETESFRNWNLVEWVTEYAEETMRLKMRPKRVRVIDNNKSQSESANQIKMRPDIRTVVGEINDYIDDIIKGSVYLKQPGKLDLSRRKYVFLSHTSNDQAKAAEIRNALKSANMLSWSYADAARTGVGDEEQMMEVPDMIASANAVLFVLTKDWRKPLPFKDKPSPCKREFELAKENHLRRIWLRFENVEPPSAEDDPTIIDFTEPDGLTESLKELVGELRRRRGRKVDFPS